MHVLRLSTLSAPIDPPLASPFTLPFTAGARRNTHAPARRLALAAPDHRLSLERGQFIVLDGAAPTRLSCLKGTLWVTQEDGVDLVVTSGDSRWLRVTGRTLIEALAPATVCLSTRGVAT